MGLHCCKSEEEITEPDDYNQNTYGNTCNQNNHEDIFKTRPPCKYGYQCPCPYHKGGGSCIFPLKSK